MGDILKSLDPALIGAVADLLTNETKARHAGNRELAAELARGRERIDEYGNVIETKFQALDLVMREHVAAEIAALDLKDGAPGEPGAKGDDGGAGPQGEPGGIGPAGPQAEPWRHRRTYDPEAKDYRAGDVVAHDGGSSIALKDDPGPCPGDGWALLTQRGKPGKPGERGERGLTGPAGPAGKAASKPVKFYMRDLQLTLELDDGTRLDCDLVPLIEAAQEAA